MKDNRVYTKVLHYNECLNLFKERLTRALQMKCENGSFIRFVCESGREGHKSLSIEWNQVSITFANVSSL